MKISNSKVLPILFTGFVLMIGFQNCGPAFAPLSQFGALSSTSSSSSDDSNTVITTPAPLTITTATLPGAAATGSVPFGTLCEKNGYCFFGYLSEGVTQTVSCQSGFINVTDSAYGGGSNFTSCQNYTASTCTGKQSCTFAFTGANCGSEPNSGGGNAGFVQITCANKMQPSVLRFADLKDSIGVQVHLAANIQDNAYTNFQNINHDLTYLGIKHVRDGAYPSGSQDALLLQAYNLLISNGVDFVSGSGGVNPDLNAFIKNLDLMVTKYPGSLYGVEGVNETSNFSFSYGGLSGQAAADQFQKELYAAVHADPLLKGIPVLNYTTGSAYFAGAPASQQKYGAGISDIANIHPYASNGYGSYQPGWYIPHVTLKEYGVMNAGPIILTEAGFNTASAANGTSFDAQAILTVNTVFDAAVNGVTRTYFYELLDMYDETAGTNADDHWGLFDGKNQPKPAATALHNLIQLLSDSSVNSKKFQLTPLSYTVKNLPDQARTLLLQMANGSYAIAIWDESHTLNSSNQLNAAAVPVTLHLDSSPNIFSSVQIYNPITNAKSNSAFAGNELSLNLTAQPMIVLLNR